MQQTLKEINSKIYDRDNLDKDLKLIEMHLDHCLDRHKFFLEAENKTDWVCIEGKPNKKCLYLEDTKPLDNMSCLKDKEGVEVRSTEGILKILFEFYHELYLVNDLAPTESEMEDFLKNIPSLPRITFDLSAHTGPITSKEVGNAIKILCLGKTPGCDGLTADFYKFFVDDLDDVLAHLLIKSMKTASYLHHRNLQY